MSDLEERNEIDLVQDWLGIYEEDHRPTYEQRSKYISDHLSLHGTDMKGEDLLTLVSLINVFVINARKKKPEATTLQVINALLGATTSKGDEFLRERLALMCEIFIMRENNFRTFGLSTKEEIIAEIKRIVDTWIPF